MSSTLRNAALRIGVIGAGPAGFYASQALLKRYTNSTIDILERLPVPFGLVRYGVSPDHYSTKNVQNQFSKFMDDNADRLKFYGNIDINGNKHISYDELSSLYHLIIKATGPTNPRQLHIKNASTSNVISAHEFIMWLNGHPDYVGNERQATKVLKSTLQRANHISIVGNGNVSLDVSRLLLYHDYERLKQYSDICFSSIDFLSTLNIQQVHILGRRCAQYASWTSSSLREILTKIPGVETYCSHKHIESCIGHPEMYQNRKQRRMLELLLKHTKDYRSINQNENKKKLHLHFEKPVHNFIRHDDNNQLEIVVSPSSSSGGNVMTDCCFLSLGYENRRTTPTNQAVAVGWANGPSARGIIADNKWDAESVVASLTQDSFHDLHHPRKLGIEQWLKQRSHPSVSWDQWKRIEREELDRGLHPNQRIRVETADEMLRIAHCT